MFVGNLLLNLALQLLYLTQSLFTPGG